MDRTYHPILYLESPLPGNHEKIIRYKSKGHRTIGFKERRDAVATILPEMVERLPNHWVTMELDDDVTWNGEGIPADVILRLEKK